MKKKKSFRRAYGFFVLILILVFLLALAVLWLAMVRFQKRTDAEKAEKERQQIAAKMEKEAPQRALENFLSETDPEEWREFWISDDPESPDDPDRLRDYFEVTLESAVCYKDESWSEAAPVYLLRTSEGEDFARIRLRKEGEDWKALQPEFLAEERIRVDFEVLSCDLVTCNGLPLGEEAIHEKEILSPLEGYETLLEDPLAICHYSLSGFLLEPEIRTEEGTETFYSKQDGTRVPVDRSEAALAAAKKGEEFVRAVLAYYMSGSENTEGHLTDCLTYLFPYGPAYQTLMESYDGVSWNPGYEEQQVEIPEIGTPLRWASNFVSVDIPYRATCSYGGKPIDYSQGNCRLIFQVAQGNYELYDFCYQ